MSTQMNRNPSLVVETDVEVPKKTKQRKWISPADVAPLQASLDMTDTEVSRALFQSDGTFRGWKSAGKMPAWVPLALERLIDKIGKASGTAPSVFVVKVPAGQVETFANVAAALGARITRVE